MTLGRSFVCSSSKSHLHSHLKAFAQAILFVWDSLLSFISKLGVLKTTFKYSDLLEELTELSKAFILMVMVRSSKKIQIEISKDKKHIRYKI